MFNFEFDSLITFYRYQGESREFFFMRVCKEISKNVFTLWKNIYIVFETDEIEVYYGYGGKE